MAENLTPLEKNTQTLAEIKTMVESLPEAGGGTDISLGITSATVGDIVKVKAVDENGKPTEWEATTAGSSSGDTTYKLLCEQTLTEAVNSVSWTTDKDGNTFDFSKYAEVVLVWTLSEDLAPDNANFYWCGDGYAFTNSTTIRKAVVKNMIFPEIKKILKDAIMFGNASYMWQSENIKQRNSWLSSYDSEAKLKPASIGLTTNSKLMPIGTYVGVLVR